MTNFKKGLTAFTQSVFLSLALAIPALAMEEVNPMAESPEAEAASAEFDAHYYTLPQEIFLGNEHDQCSGVLRVRNRAGSFVVIPRGQLVSVDVAIDGAGYWYWKCGSSLERSRGNNANMQRVKRLKVYHSTNNRRITWSLYDLL